MSLCSCYVSGIVGCGYAGVSQRIPSVLVSKWANEAQEMPFKSDLGGNDIFLQACPQLPHIFLKFRADVDVVSL
jgi:hypothetical protein